MTTDDERLLREIALIISRAIGRGIGFALFLDTGKEANYISNGHRPDVIKTLEEWLRKTSGSPPVAINVESEAQAETPKMADARLVLERKCVELGETVGNVASLIVFLFDFGEGGNLAYFTNMPKAREGVADWIKEVRSRS